MCLLIALIKITFPTQLIDKFTACHASHKSDVLCCRSQTCHSQSAATSHLTPQVISADNYSSAENWHIQGKSGSTGEEHPQPAPKEEERAPGLTASPFRRLISPQHTQKNTTHQGESCSASVPLNGGGISTTSAAAFRGCLGSGCFPVQPWHNSGSPTTVQLMNTTWAQETTLCHPRGLSVSSNLRHTWFAQHRQSQVGWAGA